MSLHYVMRQIESIDAVPAAIWNAMRRSPNPFMDLRFLKAMEDSGSVGPGTGWMPCHLVAEDENRIIVGVCPLYRKSHSYGEYVFDWAWADAYRRHGLRYYPKGLVAVPFTPVPGERLLARDDRARQALAMALPRVAEQLGWSSLHVLLGDEADSKALLAAGFLLRSSYQFHWSNPGFRDFDDYLASLVQSKRKKVRAERRKVRESGVAVVAFEGAEIDDALWSFFHACYERTYAEHHSTPYLSDGFFRQIGRTMPEHLTLFVAARETPRDGTTVSQPIAASLLLHDREAIYGRYWGAIEHVPFVHFETSYYAPIEWAIAKGLQRFEGGAQGEHKMARGFLPTPTRSHHWLAHPVFSDAVADFLQRETGGVDEHLDELEERSPLRPQTGA